MKLPELLMPAGSLEKAYVAFRYGADAIYCGLPMFSLRTRENVFTENDIREIVDYAHKNGKKVYVTTNSFPHQYMVKLYEKHFALLEEIQPDGIIFADIGVLSLARQHAPSVAKHLSVQTSTVNLPAVNMWKELGVTRIILAREMAIREVKTLHSQVPDMELEYFVHGSVCMAYSGRCLLSNFTGGRDANKGVCNHTCRWNYQVYDDEGHKVNMADHYEQKQDGEKKNCGDPQPKSIREFEEYKLVEEEKRQGQLIPIEEDFHGTHIMSSRDMCMIEYLKEIQDAGVVSLKVEGRNKTSYYTATIARAYRAALDDIATEKPFNPELWDEIHATANRGFFAGFLHGKPDYRGMQYDANQSTSKKEFCGVVQSWNDGHIEVNVKNKVEEGTTLEIVMPKRSDDFSIIAKDMRFGETPVKELHGGNTNKSASMACEQEIPIGTFLRQTTRNPGQIAANPNTDS